MRFILILSSLFGLSSVTAQLTKGNNFFTLTNYAPNDSEVIFEDYPIPVDSLGNPLEKSAVNSSGNLFFGYNFAVTNHFLFGAKLHHIGSKESTFGVFTVGPVLRFHPTIKALNSTIVFTKSGLLAENFFFIEGASLFGNMKLSEEIHPYAEYFLNVGGSLRFPSDRYRFIRHFGVELAVGIQYRSAYHLVDRQTILPNLSGGIQIYLDRNYIRFK